MVAIEDALAEDVLIAERLNGRPLDSDHGAPARLVSPNQYGYVNTKHLCAIELHTAEANRDVRPSTSDRPVVLDKLNSSLLSLATPEQRVLDERKSGASHLLAVDDYADPVAAWTEVAGGEVVDVVATVGAEAAAGVGRVAVGA